MRDSFEIVLSVAAIVAAVFLLSIGLVGGINYLDCRGFQNGTGIETRWSWSCYAKMDGAWVPKDYVFGAVKELRLKDKPKR